ncbi:MAG: glycosyltransferase family 8 protein [Deltaproteobacteria bacterium]|nr:glycosyltransferase family 8 protein [Deltaproteobacteria bacterium]
MSGADPVAFGTTQDGYALGLAVTVRSALERLDPARRLRLYLLDAGLAPRLRRRLLRCWPEDRVEVVWIRPDLTRFREVALPGFFANPAVYLRLLAEELLPEHEERAIYLDSDLVVQRDLGELWDLEMGGHPLLAVQDQGLPFVDASHALPNVEAVAPYLVAVRAVPNWEELGLDPRAKYLNAGLLVIDLAAWRREKLGSQLMQCLRDHREHAAMADQYALNACLCGRWGELDLRWNANVGIFKFPSAEESPFDAETLLQVREDPWIVHYVGYAKPWSWDSPTAWKDLWQRERDTTGWPPWARTRWTLWPWLRRRWLRWSRPLRRTLRDGRRRLSRTGRRLRAAARRRLSG